jgi:sulfur-carrier protein
MRVSIPSPLHAYTRGAGEARASGNTLEAVLADLDRQYPGLRFRLIDEQGKVRRHMRVFIAGQQVFDLQQPLNEQDEVFIVQALSGG